MEILGRKGLSGIVKCFLDLIFLGGIGIFVSLPWSLAWCFKNVVQIGDGYYIFLLILLYITGFFGLVIVYEMRKIFNNLNDKSPFVMSTVKSLNRMALSSFIISVGYGVKIVVLNSFFTMIIMMVFVMAGFFSLILAEVFRQAVLVKEENDLTV
ncbi:MAG TPA: DUF2975 domain-containing protein [Clostridiales bacterium]|nr:MAG: hypothetical protein A2Y18_00695 [Clostridiales bacterium GWD2_32_19]HCC07223.1 DUF2975 domain-containing protein [Clostridiales bacterium]